MSKTFYYDYFSLDGVDPEAWSEEFFWPVPRQTTTKITTDLKDHLSTLAAKQSDGFYSELLIIAHLMPDASIRSVNHLLSVNRIKEKGYDIVCETEKLKLIPQLLETPEEISFEHEDIWSQYPLDWKIRQLNRIRYFLISVRYNFKRGIYKFWEHFKKRAKTVAFSNANVIYRPSTLESPEWVKLTAAELWISPVIPTLNQEQKDKIDNLAQEYLDFVKSYAKNEFNLELPENLLFGLRKYNTQYLNYLAKLFIQLKGTVKESCPERFLTPTAGSSFIRALSFAAKEAGVKVIGFPHGYYIGHHKGSRKSLHEFATVDEFMAYFPGNVELLNRNVELNPLPLNNKIKFTFENNPVLKKQWNYYSEKPLPEKNRTVMILELSLIPEWAGYYAAEAMVNYHFYYNLAKVLTEAGYNVLFKKRMKSLDWDGVNIFGNLKNFKVVYGSFDDTEVLDMADAYIIQYGMSSTLFNAMCTNKTVIYADAGWEDWFEEPYKLMAKRCSILKCQYDERNRSCFDKQELFKILDKKPESPNSEFVEKYLFP